MNDTLDDLFITYPSKQAFLDECVKRYSTHCDRYGKTDYHHIVNQCVDELSQKLTDYQQEWVIGYLTVNNTFIRNPHTYIEAAREIGKIGIGNGNFLKISEETCQKLLKKPRSEAEEIRDFTTSPFWSGIFDDSGEIGYFGIGVLIGGLVILSIRYRSISVLGRELFSNRVLIPSSTEVVKGVRTVSEFSKAASFILYLGFNHFFSS